MSKVLVSLPREFVAARVTGVVLVISGVPLMSVLGAAWWWRVGGALTYLLALPPVIAYLALNFTGSTPFISKSRVKREIYTYVPIMAWLFGTGIVLTIALPLIRMLRG
jgi:hypothetical protein